MFHENSVSFVNKVCFSVLLIVCIAFHDGVCFGITLTHGTISRMSGRFNVWNLLPRIATKQETVWSRTSGGMRSAALCSQELMHGVEPAFPWILADLIAFSRGLLKFSTCPLALGQRDVILRCLPPQVLKNISMPGCHGGPLSVLTTSGYQ